MILDHFHPYHRLNEQREADRFEVPRPPEGGEALRWRPWPCPACNGSQSEISHLIRCIETGAVLSDIIATPEEVISSQATLLKGWAESCPHTHWSDLPFPQISEGSEHFVFLDAANAKVWKATKLDVYGDSYFLLDGIVNQRKCSPLEYLLRLRYWKRLFRSAPVSVGISTAGQILSTHEFVTGQQPSQDAVDSFLTQAGLMPVKRECWLWKGMDPAFEIWIGDARSDNFVETPNGIVPIDLRLWRVDAV